MRRELSSIQVLVLLGAFAAGCAGPSETGPAPIASADSSPIGLDTPLPPSLVVEGEPLPPEDERTLRRWMDRTNVPAIGIAVVHDGEIAWAGAFGLADVAAGRAATTGTLFQAASISKPVSAMGALRLVQEGKIGLDDDVNDHLTAWRVPDNEFTDPPGGDRRPVTLRGLLSHTAGLTVHGFPGYARDLPVPSTVDVLDGKGNTDAVRVDMPPGSARRYSGGGYTVVQQLIVDVSGSSFPSYMHATVLEPLGMSDSTYAQPLPETVHDRAAAGYRGDGTPVEGGWHVYPEMAAAGLWTTPSDLARFVLAVQRGLDGEDGPVLDASMVREMLTAPVEAGYGLGLGVGDGRFSHGGANEGFRCSMVGFLEGGNGAVVMTNSDRGGGVSRMVLQALFERYGWPGMEPTVKTTIAMDRGEMERYAGVYRVDGFGDVTVSVSESGDRLLYTRPDGIAGELRPESRTSFFDTKDGQTLAFDLDDGRATRFVVSGTEARRVDAP